MSVACKLNLFIVGAAKSGTTSLWHALKFNKDVFMPMEMIDKEPAYFSPLKKSRKKKAYFDLFEGVVDKKYVGESSTAYLTDEKSARKIYEYNPNSKIIIILRNPAKRAYSLYNWLVQDGYEYAPTFKKALELEKVRSKKTIPNYYEPEYYHNYLYFSSGLYCNQVKRYYDVFGKENVYVMCFEAFKKNQLTEYKKLCQFLQIEINEYETEAKNPSFYVWNSYVQFSFRKFINFMLKHHLPLVNMKSMRNRDWLLRLGVSKSMRPKKLDHKIYIDLMERYKEDIMKLSDLTDVDFRCWLEEK